MNTSVASIPRLARTLPLIGLSGLPTQPIEKSQTDTRSPLRRQFDRLKAETGGAVLLFQLGNSFIGFYTDAAVIAESLGLPLNPNSPAPQIALLATKLDRHISTLTADGFRVAICGQQ